MYQSTQHLLLYPGVSILRNCPKIADVFCMEEILCALGADTWWQEHDLYLDCTKADKTEISGIYTEKMRSSSILLGVLLGRYGKASMGYPGGCVIGKRPVDLHLYAFRKFGVLKKKRQRSWKRNAKSFKERRSFSPEIV